MSPTYFDPLGPVKNSKSAAHMKMCSDTKEALEECFASAGSSMSEAKVFPDTCADLALGQMECAVAKRDYAYQTAQQMVGKEAVEKVFPKYQESKNKALELIELYKNNAADGKLDKKDVFWG